MGRMDGAMTHHDHAQAPSNPTDGDAFTCRCGVAFEFVDLDDGRPGEWVSTA